MSALPESLARWSALALDFPVDIAQALFPWMEQLSRAIGPLRAQVRVGEGDPDGVDGVTRRAPLDRLLDTERLLATEIPDEFVRRAAQGELLFHALALKEYTPPRASLLLVDAGPAQLGAPRLVHLALLFVLAERARSARARFAWGVLQEPPVEGRAPKLVEGIDGTQPAAVILERRALPPVPDDVSAWEDFARRAGWDDLWFVGEDPRPSRRLRGGAVRVREPVQLGAQRLDVEIDHGGRVIHRALELPAADAQARVLRDPRSLFASRAVPVAPTPTRVVGGVGRAEDVAATVPLFLNAGRKLLACNAQGDPLVFTVPTMGMKSGRPKRWTRPSGERVLAAGWYRRRLVLLTRRGDALLRFDWRGDVFPMVSAPLRVDDPTVSDALRERPDGAALLELHFPNASEAPGVALLRLDDGRLLRVARDGGVSALPHQVLALGETRGRLVMACVARDSGSTSLPGVEVATFAENRRAALIGSAWHHRYVIATRESGARWTLERLNGEVISLEPGDEPLGVLGSGTTSDPFRIAALDESRRTIFACGADRLPLYRFSEALIGAAVERGGAEIAAVSRTGALRVLRHPGHGLRVARGELGVAT